MNAPTPPRRFLLRLAVPALALIGTPRAASALDSVWQGGTGNFFNAAKWSLGPPGDFSTSETSSMTLYPFTGPVYFIATTTIDNGTATLNPGVTTVYNLTGDPDARYSTPYYVNFLGVPDLTIGRTGAGGLSIGGNMYVGSPKLELAVNAGSSGTFTVDGAPLEGRPSNFFCSGDTLVGIGGIGRMNLSNGARATYCDGYFRFVSPGGEVHWNKWLAKIGVNGGSNGWTTVRGAGSQLNYATNYFKELQYAAGMVVGDAGAGGLTIEQGGAVTSRAARLGYAAGGNGMATVTGANSRWDIDGQLWVGEQSQGSLLISNGGAVVSGNGPFYDGTIYDLADPEGSDYALEFGSVGSRAGSSGSVTINGAGSRWEHHANLVVGDSGTGSVTLEGGGVLSSGPRASLPDPLYFDASAATLGLLAGSQGSLTVTGTDSRWENAGGLIVGDRGTGKLTLASGGRAEVGGDGRTRLGLVGDGEVVFGGPTAVSPGTLGGSVIEGGAGTSTVTFQHTATAGYTLGHTLRHVTIVRSTGTGRSILSGPLEDIGGFLANAGTLEIGPRAAAVPIQGGSVNGGKLVLRGATVTLPTTGFAAISISKGSLDLLEGGKLKSALNISGSAGSAALTVDGAGSVLTPQRERFIVGYQGFGSLTVSHAGRVGIDPAFNPPCVIGDLAAGSGAVTVTGGGSRWDTGWLSVGHQGSGLLRLENGGLVQSQDAAVAAEGGSGTAELDTSARWQVTAATLPVGRRGQGRVILSGGATLHIGPGDAGDLVLGSADPGSGTLQIGSGGTDAPPGNLAARSVYSGSSPQKAIVSMRHSAASYLFHPTLTEVDFRLASGNTGTTTLTSPYNFLSYATLTSGGLRLAQGGSATMDSELIVGDGGTFDLDDYSPPFLEVDGPSSVMDAGSGIRVGKSGDGQVRLKNGGKLKIRDHVHQAENALLLGDDASDEGQDCSVVFGGSPTTAPGVLEADEIHGYAAAARVEFNHSAADYTLTARLGGNLSVQHSAGTTLLAGSYLGYSGATKVTGGTLLVAANLPSIVTLSSGATFGGKGTIARINAPSGTTLSPGTFRSGEAIAALRVTQLNLYGGSKIRIDLGPNLTCDQILNHKNSTTVTTFYPVTSGNVTFEFHNRGISRNGVYPVLTTTNPIPTNLMSRLLFTSDFNLQGSFRQTQITGDPQASGPYYQLEFVSTSYTMPAYEAWVSAPEYGLDPLTTGLPATDYDRDGLANVLEYVLGSSPVSGTAAHLPKISRSGNTVTFSLQRRLAADSQFLSELQYSPDLVTWNTAPSFLIQRAPIGATGFESVTATFDAATFGPRIYARLKVTPLRGP